MRTRKLEFLALAFLTAAIALGSAACQKKTETTAAAPPGESMTTTTTTTTTTSSALESPAAAAETTVVTADPVIASQRNASRRRAASKPRSASTGEGSPGYSEERQAPPPPAPAAKVVPEGTILRVAFDESISTATAQVGDTVNGKLLDDILADDGSVVAGSGSRVVGKIEHVIDSGKLARPAELRFRLTELNTRFGAVPIQTSAYERVGKTHTKRNVEYIAGGAAVGAIIGQVLGKDTESTLKGAAAGAAVGTGVAAATGDLDFTIDAGRTVAFTLEQPVTVR